ncbi:MAG: alpha/beta hydrolase-fold protein, partial [Bacteroidota bacterium]
MDVAKQVSLTFHLRTDIHDDRPVYLAGSFNDWNEHDERFRLQELENGHYFFHLAEADQLRFPIEYKYTKGSWQEVELDAAGESVDNRRLESPVEKVEDYVPHWLRHGQAYQDHLLPKIEMLSEQFEIPQLVKTRRVTALLPHDYYESDQHYPVLYLQDGQNLFDDHAPYGSWEVNKKLAMMAERGMANIIVVAIDHAEEDRIEEFTPSSNTRLGSGDGKKYARFLADTLKPHENVYQREVLMCRPESV